MTLLSADLLQFSLNKKNIIEKITIEINAGEYVGLIGPNGAGKSSLLRVLAGLVKPDAGEIHLCIDGKKELLQKIPAQARARSMAYLAQHETPAWPLTVANLVALGREPWNDYFSQDTTNNTQAINDALQSTDVIHLSDRPITELSGGELQRVMLARVFAGKPQLIVADEPIAALDIYHQLHIMELLQEHSRKGGAVIAALHDLSLAARFCSRLILINHGKIVAQGKPVDVLTPKNIADVYGVNTHVECNEGGVVIIPEQRLQVFLK